LLCPAGDSIRCTSCRRKRIQELQAAAAKPRFGSVEEISSNEFIEKVTNTSEKAWVVCFLYKSSHAGCALLGECLDELARKYHGTRFVKIISTSCIPNYPDQNLPTLLLYHNRWGAWRMQSWLLNVLLPCLCQMPAATAYTLLCHLPVI
jgi:hypothetical protein